MMKEGGLGAGVVAPAAVPVPPRPDGVQDEPMNGQEASRKRRAEDAGHEADGEGRGGAQPDPGSMVDDSTPELRREAQALRADAVALAEAHSPASRQRAGAFGLSAGVAMDLRFGMGSGAASRPGQSLEEVERRETAFAHFEFHVLRSLSAATHQAGRVGKTAGAGQGSHGVRIQSGRIANRPRWDVSPLGAPWRGRRSRACGS